jgi:hypothetical protein
LAQRGIEVIAADPAAASIDVAQQKSGAEFVRWLVGDAPQLPAIEVEMVTMTGNVVEHLDDNELLETFRVCNASLVPGGHIAVGSRNPNQGQWWLDWDPDTSARRTDIPGVGVVQDRLDITDAGPRHFSFTWTFVFESDNATYEWSATFPLRTPAEVASALNEAGFEAVSLREDDDLFVARRAHRTTAP